MMVTFLFYNVSNYILKNVASKTYRSRTNNCKKKRKKMIFNSWMMTIYKVKKETALSDLFISF